jgi:hypothetical protein
LLSIRIYHTEKDLSSILFTFFQKDDKIVPKEKKERFYAVFTDFSK